MDFRFGKAVTNEHLIEGDDVVYRLVRVIDEGRGHEKPYGEPRRRLLDIQIKAKELFPQITAWTVNREVGKYGCYETKFYYEKKHTHLRIYPQRIR